MKWPAEKRDWNTLAVALVFLSLGVFYMVKDRIEWRSFGASAVVTQGVVTDAARGWRSRDDGEPDKIKYEFRVNGTQFRGMAETFIPVGDVVEIKYLSEDPNRNVLAGDEKGLSGDFGMAVIAALIGGYLFCVGCSEKTLRMLNHCELYTGKFEPSSFERFPVIVTCVFSAFLVLASLIGSPEMLHQKLRWFLIFTCLIVLIRLFQWGPKAGAWGVGIVMVRYNPFLLLKSDLIIIRLLDFAIVFGLLFVASKLAPPVKNPCGTRAG